MLRQLTIISAISLLAFPALSADNNNFNGWRAADFRRVALEMSSTSVSNAEEYQNSPNSQLSADSETLFKGVLILHWNTDNRNINGTIRYIWNMAKPN